MSKKEKKLFIFLFISHIYCLINAFLYGGINGNKLEKPRAFLLHFLLWWCVWNSLLTIAFILWKVKNPHKESYGESLFSLITMLSNFITISFYIIGLGIWGLTALTTYWGFTTEVIKIVPIASSNKEEIGKVVWWWLYSPWWHMGVTTCFIHWFFHHQRTKLLRKRLWVTIAYCLIMPGLYYCYCLLRHKLSPKEYINSPFHRWPYFFFSSKKIAPKLGVSRFTWKIVVIFFWFIFFGLVSYYCLKLKKQRDLTKKKSNKKNFSSLPISAAFSNHFRKKK